MLIEEADISRCCAASVRSARGTRVTACSPYNLQHVIRDRAFFREKRWYDFDHCMDRAMRVLRSKYARTGDLWSAVRAYNGSGSAAMRYASNVFQFTNYCAEVDG